jgi:hypothetical protein
VSRAFLKDTMNEYFAGLDSDNLVNRLADVAEAALGGNEGNNTGTRPAKPGVAAAAKPLPWKIIGLVVGGLVLAVVAFKALKKK